MFADDIKVNIGVRPLADVALSTVNINEMYVWSVNIKLPLNIKIQVNNKIILVWFVCFKGSYSYLKVV